MFGEDNGKEKGNYAEQKFKEWLDKHNIPYFYIQQDKETFSSTFKDFSGKRPDFMILIPSFGFIFVDVKNKDITSHKTYCLDSKETKKYSSIQRKFNVNVWYVISNENFDYKTWLWIPISKVLESEIEEHTSSVSKEKFFAVPVNEFTQIADYESLDKLFLRCFEN